MSFQATSNCTPDPGSTGCGVTILNVPAGKRLVIEYVSVEAFTPAGQVAFFEVTTQVNLADVIHRSAMSQPAVSFNGIGRATLGQHVRIYADPGTAVRVVGVRSGTPNMGGFNFAVSGHLVDIP